MIAALTRNRDTGDKVGMIFRFESLDHPAFEGSEGSTTLKDEYGLNCCSVCEKQRYDSFLCVAAIRPPASASDRSWFIENCQVKWRDARRFRYRAETTYL